MATLSTPGIGSGLDVRSIVRQLVALERRPIDLLQAQVATIQTKLSSFSLLQSYTSNVRDAADKLAKTDFWTATSADSASVGVTSTSTAAAATYQVNVTALAQALRWREEAFSPQCGDEPNRARPKPSPTRRPRRWLEPDIPS